jgi:peptidoglycan/LPS O-acetylase OafA/YrhL
MMNDQEARGAENKNNFDLIRLIAAMQVAVVHIFTHLGIDGSLIDCLSYLPGVPVFFFISGYLISKSFAKSSGARWQYRNFFMNRFFRLYPALIICFVFSLFSAYLTGYLNTVQASPAEIVTWVVAQITVFQFYNPEFMRNYGTGVLNGSLWTIAVEIQFYILTPILAVLFSRRKILWGALFVAFLIINALNTALNPLTTVPGKILNVSFLPWLYMFMAGVYVAESDWARKFIMSLNPVLCVVLYLSSYLVGRDLGLGAGNNINVVSFLLLCIIIYRSAHAFPDISGRVLRGNDISYGVYIYHMPVVNLVLYYGLQGNIGSALLAITVTLLLASISWFYIEKRALRFKRRSSRWLT